MEKVDQQNKSHSRPDKQQLEELNNEEEEVQNDNDNFY